MLLWGNQEDRMECPGRDSHNVEASYMTGLAMGTSEETADSSFHHVEALAPGRKKSPVSLHFHMHTHFTMVWGWSYEWENFTFLKLRRNRIALRLWDRVE